MCIKFYNIISGNEKSILKYKYPYKKKLSNLLPGCEVNPTRISHDPNKVNFTFSSYALKEKKKKFTL